jgi:hypothetical protein
LTIDSGTIPTPPLAPSPSYVMNDLTYDCTTESGKAAAIKRRRERRTDFYIDRRITILI